jgi:hypothetical protein
LLCKSWKIDKVFLSLDIKTEFLTPPSFKEMVRKGKVAMRREEEKIAL